jgi:hypothetical protein
MFLGPDRASLHLASSVHPALAGVAGLELTVARFERIADDSPRLDGIVGDYADDALFITPDGVEHGTGGVREGFVKLLGDVPQADWEVPTG